MIKQLTRLIKKLRKKSKNAYESTWNVAGTGLIGGGTGFVSFNNSVNPMTTGIMSPDVVTDPRIVKKPVEVVDDIMIEQPVLDLENLDTKIKVVKRRIKVLQEQSVNLTDEREALFYLVEPKVVQGQCPSLPLEGNDRREDPRAVG